MKKIGIISSKGGHLMQLIQIRKIFSPYPHFWVTYKGEDTKYYLENEKVYYAFYPESRNIINGIKNFFLSFLIFNKERPTILISSGAGIAVPMFIVGKFFFNTKLIYFESFDYVSYPSLTGKIIYNIADIFLIQHRSQKKWYPQAKYCGSLL